LRISLDAGEAEAIALAKEIGADLVLLDDSDGRNIAKSVGIMFTVTIGILLRYYHGHPTDKTPLMNYWHKGSDCVKKNT